MAGAIPGSTRGDRKGGQQKRFEDALYDMGYLPEFVNGEFEHPRMTFLLCFVNRILYVFVILRKRKSTELLLARFMGALYNTLRLNIFYLQ